MFTLYFSIVLTSITFTLRQSKDERTVFTIWKIVKICYAFYKITYIKYLFIRIVLILLQIRTFYPHTLFFKSKLFNNQFKTKRNENIIQNKFSNKVIIENSCIDYNQGISIKIQHLNPGWESFKKKSWYLYKAASVNVRCVVIVGISGHRTGRDCKQVPC